MFITPEKLSRRAFWRFYFASVAGAAMHLEFVGNVFDDGYEP